MPAQRPETDSGRDLDRYRRLNVKDFKLRDFFNLLFALRGEPSQPATASFDVRWGDVQQILQQNDPDVGFEGLYIVTDCTIEWSASTEGFEFTSDPADTSSSTYAIIGDERNGVYYE